MMSSYNPNDSTVQLQFRRSFNNSATIEMLTAQEASHLHTFLTSVKCPLCEQPITEKRNAPQGVELPFCCGLFWIPVWQLSGINAVLKIHLFFFDADAHIGPVPLPNNVLVEVPAPENAPENANSGTVQTDIDAVIPENSTENSGEGPGAFNSQPLVIGTAEELTTKERIIEFLAHVNAQHEARTGEIIEALQIAPSTFKRVSDELIDEEQVEKVGYGRYRLLRRG